ncbi:MAG: transcriptional regulator, partial [Acidobacteriota bacterium]
MNAPLIYAFEDFSLDAEFLMLSRSAEEISLTPKVVETLLALVERHGEIVSKDELMDRVWENAFVEESNLVQNIYVLRKALGETGDGRPMIETLRRRGYRFNGEVRAVEKEKRLTPLANENAAASEPPGGLGGSRSTIFAIGAGALVMVVLIGFAITRMTRSHGDVSAAEEPPLENTLKRLTPDLYSRSPV